MIDVALGQVVLSKTGRDKGCFMIVVEVSGDFVYLVDGDVRKCSKPKRKNIRHIAKTNQISELICEKLENQLTIDDDIVSSELKIRRKMH